MPSDPPAFYTIDDLATRWHCSDTHVRRQLAAHGVKVLDFQPDDGSKGKKLVPAAAVQKLEKSLLRSLR